MLRSYRMLAAALLACALLAVAPSFTASCAKTAPLVTTVAAMSQLPARQEQAPEKQNPNTQPDPPSGHDGDNDRPLTSARVHNPVLWRQPEDIPARDLFYGQGGEKHQPEAPFKFESESKHGSNPKFDARDARGKRWRVKLAEEARPEVVASRLLWAMGFYANDDYLLPDAAVEGLELKRGGDLIHDGHVTEARFVRKPGGQKKIGTWKWKSNPFLGSREFNGLRVMMAVMNNWDLKDENNAVYRDEKNDQDIFLVSDVGATFATTHLTNSRSKDKGNVENFKNSKFIVKTTDSMVDFGTPAPPTGILLGSFGFTAAEFFKRKGLDWIGKDIPRQDARWMASFLAQLTHQQIVDAFRAGHFPQESTDEYVNIVEDRIAQLKAL